MLNKYFTFASVLVFIMKISRILALTITILMIFNTASAVYAANITFKGTVPAELSDKSVTLALYNQDADINNIKPDDIKYIDQSGIDENGNFVISIPLSMDEITSYVAVSNVSNINFVENKIYCSATGTENGNGTLENPYTFQKALEVSTSGDVIMVNGKITLPADFVWSKANKNITVRGADSSAVLDLRTLIKLDINCDTVFENLTFGCDADTSRIAANGYHVVIKETVKTENIIKSLIAGSTTGDVASTNLEVYGGNYVQIWGGCDADGGAAKYVTGNSNLIVGGTTNSAYSVKDGDTNYYATKVFGGGWGGGVKGNCTLTLKDNARAAYVYGSNNGSVTSYVSGKITVNIMGGQYMNVYACSFITEGKTVDAAINMTGGTVEGIFASDTCTLTGDIAINCLGGNVTRRIYLGCYNDWNVIWKSDHYVNGNVTLTVGKDAVCDFTMSDEDSNGISGGSRRNSNHEEEITKIIFLDDSYERFKTAYKNSGLFIKKDADYIVKANAGGKISPVKGNGAMVNIVPDKGYLCENTGNYTLENSTTTVTFILDKDRITGVTTPVFTKNLAKVNVNYSFNSAFKPSLIVAIYDENFKLETVTYKTIDNSSDNENFNISCNLESGKTYHVRAMMWRDMENLIPVCTEFTINVPVSD